MDESHKLIINAARALTSTAMIEPASLVVEQGRIARISREAPPETSQATIIDASAFTVVPGFVDMHVHGAAGYDTMDATAEALEGRARFFAHQGVTSFLPTTVAASQPRLLAAIQNVAAFRQKALSGARAGCPSGRAVYQHRVGRGATA